MVEARGASGSSIKSMALQHHAEEQHEAQQHMPSIPPGRLGLWWTTFGKVR